MQVSVDNLVFLLAGLVIGGLLAYLFIRSLLSRAEGLASGMQSELDNLRNDKVQREAELSRLSHENVSLETRLEDAFIHVLLMVILLTGFVIEGARMAVTEIGTSLSLWSPVGLLFAKGLAGIDKHLDSQLHH